MENFKDIDFFIEYMNNQGNKKLGPRGAQGIPWAPILYLV